MTLPFINTILFAGMTLVNRFPQAFNYLETITPENAERQYRAATRMIRYMKLAIAIVFAIITYSTVKATQNGESDLVIWVLPFLILSMLGLLVYYALAAKKE